jgi:uncharacterized damage-inducible protein DinB
MKNPEIHRIIVMMNNTYNGAAWHGASILEILRKINSKQAFSTSKHIHRICELVQHITAWRVFTVKKLEGDQHYDVSQNENWKTTDKHDQAAWDEILAELEKSQQQLVNALKNFSDSKLDDEVPGKSYNYYTLVHGVIHHDLYHLGEIALLANELNGA